MNKKYISSSAACYHILIIKTYKLNQQMHCGYRKSLLVHITLKLWHLLLLLLLLVVVYFNDAFCNSDYIATDIWIITDQALVKTQTEVIVA
jgi:hypothetical protein